MTTVGCAVSCLPACEDRIITASDTDTKWLLQWRSYSFGGPKRNIDMGTFFYYFFVAFTMAGLTVGVPLQWAVLMGR